MNLANGRAVEMSGYTLHHSSKIQGEVVARQTLKIETSPDGGELAAGLVPDGKIWEYNISISIVERDA